MDVEHGTWLAAACRTVIENQAEARPEASGITTVSAVAIRSPLRKLARNFEGKLLSGFGSMHCVG